MEIPPDNWWETWWFGGIILALAINLGTAYLKPMLDKWWGQFSGAQRAKNAAFAAFFEMQVQEMLHDHAEFIYVNTQLIRADISLLISFILFAGVLPLAGNEKITVLIGIVLFLMVTNAYWSFRSIIKYRNLITAYRTRKEELWVAGQRQSKISTSPATSSDPSPQSSDD